MQYSVSRDEICPQKKNSMNRFCGFPKDLACAAVFAVFILSASIVFVLCFRPLFYLDIPLFQLEKEAGLPAETIRNNYDKLIGYLMLWNRQSLILPDFRMSESGRIHFADCKKIFDLVQILFLLSGVMLLARGMILKSRKETLWHVSGEIGFKEGMQRIHGRPLYSSRCLFITGFLLTGIPAAIGLFALLDWEKLFVSFHKLFFSNDYWLFDPATDPVILILPDGFFFQCLAVILVLVIGSGLICIARAIKIRKADKYG